IYRLFSAAASHRPTIFPAGKTCFTKGTASVISFSAFNEISASYDEIKSVLLHPSCFIRRRRI
ncbi:MAG: hypothetical protein IKM29_05250, partial [Clostridia bacterium]|nr:hypothetical protein [Clostridia bacterium]